MTTCTRPRCDRTARHGHPLCETHLYAAGIYQPRVPIAPIRAHLTRCVEEGATLTGIATGTGIGTGTVMQIMGHYDRDQGHVSHRTARRLMRATGDMAGHVPSWPYTRRVRAMRAGGHSNLDIATSTGLSVCCIAGLAAGEYDRLRTDTADTIRASFDRLSTETRTSIDQRTLAHGWGPPMLWDDIDDPDESHQAPTGRVHVSGPVLAAIGVLDTAYGRPGAEKATGVSQSLLRHFVAGSRLYTSPDTARAILRAAGRIQRQAVAA
ncbi:hypothetical protein [Corynebacterium sp.]|uniref:hypothetical protein n=1 Tax=Corynebacterium sp. TaxID=1720 RepID=UPI0025BDC52C|nr:hypothetical protein [Corynebacterium sp.]